MTSSDGTASENPTIDTDSHLGLPDDPPDPRDPVGLTAGGAEDSPDAEEGAETSGGLAPEARPSPADAVGSP